MKAIGYIRVSTDEQVSGFGLDIQRKAIERYCLDHDLELVDVLSDEGISGSNGLDNREGLAEALARIEGGEAETLVVYRFDRLARKLLIQLTVIDRLEKVMANVLSVSEPQIDGPDELRDLIRNILGAVAGYEAAVIRGRLASGRRAKAAAGGFIGGTPKFGFDNVGGNLVENPIEQTVIEEMKLLRRNGFSLRDIADEMNKTGVRPKLGQRWQPTTVSRILKRA